MTVAELIARLQTMPADAEVNVDDGDFWPLTNVRESDPAGIVVLEYMTAENRGRKA